MPTACKFSNIKRPGLAFSKRLIHKKTYLLRILVNPRQIIKKEMTLHGSCVTSILGVSEETRLDKVAVPVSVQEGWPWPGL